jgi:peptidoglycan/LPS O-acetylase OafA/YrhL
LNSESVQREAAAGKSAVPALLSGRLRSIDALRGAAALGVVLYHTVGPHARFGPRVLNWIAVPAVPVIRLGYVGVFLFFVISGFCIHLSRARSQAEGKPAIDFSTFWKRRLKRLYPPYLIALVVYLGIAAFTSKVELNFAYVWDVILHVFMLHNLDSHTVYSINGVFWTLAIEEQLYLAYFLLVFLRKRLGWGMTLGICLIVRVAWFFGCMALRDRYGISIPISEGAASHWFTWSLGALSVEAMFGLVKLPAWCYRARFALMALLASVGLTYLLPVLEFNKTLHDAFWQFLHPLWGLGFFLLLNRAVITERRWRLAGRPPLPIRGLAAIGLFSYSLYLTHELVVMESYLFGVFRLSEMATALLLTTPFCVAFAWLFFQVAERPFLNTSRVRKQPTEIAAVVDA